MTSRVDWATRAAILAGTAVGIPLGIQTAEAWTANQNPQGLRIYEDYYVNYDFSTRSATRDNVDWTISIIYNVNANITKIKNMYWGTIGCGFGLFDCSMEGKINDGAGYVWDTDSGTKNMGCTLLGYAKHMRLYAGPADRLLNQGWGYYVIASVHEDRRECGIDPDSGWSENMEDWFVNYADGKPGVTVAQDWAWFYNPEPERQIGDHHWQQNGLGSVVHVP